MGSKRQDYGFCRTLARDSDLYEYLRGRNIPARVGIDDEPAYNFGDWYGVDVFGGFVASMPANVYRIQAHPQARALFGVNYVISREVQQAEYVGRSGLQIYRNASAFPRAWVVHRARSVPTEQVAAALGLPLEEHRTVAFVRGPAPELAGCGATGSAILVERLADRLTIDADLPCPGLVVVSETWFPG